MKTYDRAISLKFCGWMYDDYDYECGDTFEDYAKNGNMDMVFSSDDEIGHNENLSKLDLYCVLLEKDINGITSQIFTILPGEYVKLFIKSVKKHLECYGEAYHIFKMEDGKLI